MKVLHVSWSDNGGGAMRATLRLHRSMRAEGVDSAVLVAQKFTDDPTVMGPEGGFARRWAKLRQQLGAKLSAFDRTPRFMVRSYNLFPTGLHRRINGSDADIVHLHWVGFETLSIRELGCIRKPIVWTMRDMWPFSGALHYEDETCPDRFAEGYEPLLSNGGRWISLDLDRWTFRRKKRAWRDVDLHIVGLSRWITDCAKRSSLFRERSITHIPNAIDLDLFRPRDKAMARSLFGLPFDARIILFGAVGGDVDPRKGAPYLYDALDRVWDGLSPEGRTKTIAVVYGSSVAKTGTTQMPVRAIGAVSDDAALAMLHTAADIFVAPSLQENLPNTVIEAAACGRPAVAFDIGGMSDVILNGETGFLVPPRNSLALAESLADLLTNDDRRAAFGSAARRHAEARFASKIVVKAYRDLYRQILETY